MESGLFFPVTRGPCWRQDTAVDKHAPALTVPLSNGETDIKHAPHSGGCWEGGAGPLKTKSRTELMGWGI